MGWSPKWLAILSVVAASLFGLGYMKHLSTKVTRQAAALVVLKDSERVWKAAHDRQREAAQRATQSATRLAVLRDEAVSTTARTLAAYRRAERERPEVAAWGDVDAPDTVADSLLELTRSHQGAAAGADDAQSPDGAVAGAPDAKRTQEP